MTNDPESSAGIVVIGASAGGLSAISELLAELPENYPRPVVVASHSGPDSRLVEALKVSGKIKLPLERATDGVALDAGKIYVVPGATHAFIENRTIILSPPVKDSGYRPSIDALFMTAAASYQTDTIAVVLSGTMNDGMRGAQVVYDVGGITIVQDPRDADYANMPQSVINADHPHEILSASNLGKWLVADQDNSGKRPHN